MQKKEPTLWERALFLVAPKKGEQAYQARTRSEPAKAAPQGAQMRASGYGNHGASRTLNSMIGWIVGGGSAQEDIDEHGNLLRKRSRDLYAGGGLARGGINALRTNVVGIGVQPKPKIDGAMLRMSDEACGEWERNTLREFRLFAENNMCDAERQKNFYALQRLAFLSMLMSGDVFAVFGMKENKRTPYRTTIRLLEADRISTPNSGGDSEIRELPNGGMIVDGVEIDREGAVVRYHIASRHPLSDSAWSSLQWVAVDAIGSETGYPNILHITTWERPEQRRGIPFVASQVEQIKQLDRYITSELAANVVASMLAAFIETGTDDGKSGLEDAVNEDEKVTDDPLKIELAPGAVYELPPGKKLNALNPIRNNTAFDAFITTLETIIGSGMEIPKEVLIKKYESNYTAARGALLDFWKTVKMYRADFIANFNRPVYEHWLAEAVSAGRIEAPSFFDDPAIREAWCGCLWMGASMGHVDPLKEVKAAGERIANNITTQEQEAMEYNGNDWNENIRQRKKEIGALGDGGGRKKAEEKKKDGEADA